MVCAYIHTCECGAGDGNRRSDGLGVAHGGSFNVSSAESFTSVYTYIGDDDGIAYVGFSCLDGSADAAAVAAEGSLSLRSFQDRQFKLVHNICYKLPTIKILK